MADTLKLSLVQLNQVVGDLAGNRARIVAAALQSPDADLVITPELSICGYPPEDMIFRASFVDACMASAEKLAEELAAAGAPAVVVGSPWKDDPAAPKPFNTALLLAGGTVAGVARKVHLPNYGPFDEPRTFEAATEVKPVPFGDWQLGLMICEDMWFSPVSQELGRQGADILIAPHGSPYRNGVKKQRTDHAAKREAETGLPVLFVNQVGGQDELVFDGGAFALSGGEIVASLPLFCEAQTDVRLVREGTARRMEQGVVANWPEDEARAYEAVVTGTRDYVQKSGFKRGVLGLSGGIDSALVAAIAVDALGAENVHCVRLPSRYTSDASMIDAAACANALGVRLDTVAIEPGVLAMGDMLGEIFAGLAEDVTEENIQSRLRGTVLMAISNKLGSMMLTTGNKSEMAVGYATLYGDMNGGYNPLKDLYKTEVFAIARWRNRAKPSWALGPDGEVIPEAIITKPPSAELRPDQKDEDSLPPYDDLDAILMGLVEDEVSVDALVERGFDRAVVERMQSLLFRAEFKRRQSAPGPKVSNRNFGRDRRYPIINRFKG